MIKRLGPQGNHSANVSNVPPLPRSVKASTGETIRLEGASWFASRNNEGRGRVTITVGRLRNPIDFSVSRKRGKAYSRRRSIFSDRLIHLMLLFTVSYLRRKKPSSAAGVVGGFIHFERFLHDDFVWVSRKKRFNASDLSPEILDNYSRHLANNHPGNVRYGSFLRSFYSWGVAQRYEGFDFIALRKMKKVAFRAQTSGRIAQIHDPKVGALTWEEERQLVFALDHGAGRPYDRATVMLFWETGIRPESAVLLRNRDVVKTPNPDVWWLMVPKVKQGRIATEPFKVAISGRLGELLDTLLRRRRDGNGFLLHWADGPQPTNELRKCIARWAIDANLLTVRLRRDKKPEPLPLTPYRLRRTLATNMAERGATSEDIAEALGDKTLAMAAVYAANSSMIVDILAKTLDRHAAWRHVLSIFRGEIVNTVPDLPAIFGGVPHFVGYEEIGSAIGVIGWCNSSTPCALFPPLSCYRCPFFLASPKADAHETQLKQVVMEGDANIGVESDRMAATLLDDMGAIVGVISEIRARTGLRSLRRKNGDVMQVIKNKRTRRT